MCINELVLAKRGKNVFCQLSLISWKYNSESRPCQRGPKSLTVFRRRPGGEIRRRARGMSPRRFRDSSRRGNAQSPMSDIIKETNPTAAGRPPTPGADVRQQMRAEVAAQVRRTCGDRCASGTSRIPESDLTLDKHSRLQNGLDNSNRPVVNTNI